MSEGGGDKRSVNKVIGGGTSSTPDSGKVRDVVADMFGVSSKTVEWYWEITKLAVRHDSAHPEASE